MGCLICLIIFQRNSIKFWNINALAVWPVIGRMSTVTSAFLDNFTREIKNRPRVAQLVKAQICHNLRLWVPFLSLCWFSLGMGSKQSTHFEWLAKLQIITAAKFRSDADKKWQTRSRGQIGTANNAKVSGAVLSASGFSRQNSITRIHLIQWERTSLQTWKPLCNCKFWWWRTPTVSKSS